MDLGALFVSRFRFHAGRLSRYAPAILLCTLLVAACRGGDDEVGPTPSRTSITVKPTVAASFPPFGITPGFPVILPIEVGKGELTVNYIVRSAEEKDGQVELTIDGSLSILQGGTFDYRLQLTDSEERTYEDDGALLLGEQSEAREVPFQATVIVPADVVLTSLGIDLPGGPTPERGYQIDLPVKDLHVGLP